MNYGMSTKIKRMNERLRQAREEAGFKTATEAITHFSWRTSTYRAHENGQNPYKAEDALIYAKAYGVSPGWLLTGETKPSLGRKTPFTAPPQSISYVSIVGVISAGLWREAVLKKQFALNPSPSLVPADPRYPADAQYDFKVEGASINKFANDGDYLRCVDFNIANLDVNDGDLVVVERVKGGDLIETTAKRVHRSGSRYELFAETDDPQWGHEPLIIDTAKDNREDIKFIAKVLWAYRFD
jgi:SOS-response transcriptional repressor LexA